MKTTVKNISETKVEVTITLDAKALADAEKVAISKLSKTIKVPGFRQGKVPVSVAAKHVDPQALQEKLLDDAISKAVAQAFIAEKIQALDRPMVDVKKYVPGEMLEFIAEAEVYPVIKLGDYKKLTKKAEKITVTNADVDDVIKRMMEGFSNKTETTKAAKIGDEAVIDFVGKKDDVAFDGGTGSDYTLKLGSGQFIPGFEEGIVGHKAGEEFDLKLKFPADYHAKDLAGQEVVFSTTLKKVLEVTLPKPDDDFAKKAGNFTSIAELKASIKEEITSQKEVEANNKLKDALIEELIQKSTVPTPDTIVDAQMKSIEQDFAQNLMYRGLDLHTYLETSGFKDENDWRDKEVRPAAISRTQAGLVLNELTKQENIEATDAEVDAEISRYKKQYYNNPQLLKQLDDEQVRRDITNHYITEKTVNHLLDLNGGSGNKANKTTQKSASKEASSKKTAKK